MPDMQCTLFPDGYPWPFGSGDEWLHCCIAHDLGGSDIALAKCMAASGGWPIAAIALTGVIFGRPLYRLARRLAARKALP